MTTPFSLLLALLGLIVSARARFTAVILGQPVSVPWLAVAAAIVLMALAVLVLLLVRVILSESRPVPGAAT